MKSTLRLLPWLLALAAAPCLAEVQLSLPFEGHYRPGRYMPVRVLVRGEGAGPLILSADGAVPVVLQLANGGADCVVPLLAVRQTLGPLSWSLPGGRSGRANTSFVPLGAQDRLVGSVGGATADAAALFPDATIVPVPLDLAHVRIGAAFAWDTLDAVVVDRALELPWLDMLTCGGTAVLVRSGRAPDPGWLPWRRVGSAWVMEQAPAGPRGAVVPEAYDPVYGWNPGRPKAVRSRAVLLAAVIAILAVAVTLWRSRRAALAVIVLSAAATGGIALWSARRSPVVGVGGSILVRRTAFFQADVWSWFKSLAPARAEYPAWAGTKPVFASPGHFESAGVVLECRSDGAPMRFTYRLSPGEAMAFLTRNPVSSNPYPAPAAAARGSPLWPLVRQAYLGPEARAAGEVPNAPVFLEPLPDWSEQWPGIVIESSP